MVILDTNSILRFVLKDNLEMSDIVKKTINEQSCLVPVEIVAELVYVLTKVYDIDRVLVSNTLKDFFEISNVNVLKYEIVNFALTLFANTNLDFVDSLLISYSKIENYDILTFDKELKKYLLK
jgi:predicted nucleic-acid-binding protein